MKYCEMVEFLKTKTVDQLSQKVGVSYRTMYKFLVRNGYQFIQDQPAVITKRRKRIDALEGIYGEESLFNSQEKLSSLQKQIIIGTLFGDSGLYWSTEGETAYLKCEHTWSQFSYLKVKIELLKPFSFNPFVGTPQKSVRFQNYHAGFCCHSTEEFTFYKNLFYTQQTEKKNIQKNVMNLEIWDHITPISLAYWMMDDGKKYGSAFAIIIGKQPYYNSVKLEECVSFLNKKFCFDLKAGEERNCYTIKTFKGSPVIDSIRDYVLPEFYYKIGLLPEDCGKFYESFDWYQKWKIDRMNIENPFISLNQTKLCYKKFSENFKTKYFNAVLSQVIARGFPFIYISEEERLDCFERIKNSQVNVVDNVLKGSTSLNSLANSFMNHRYKLRVRNTPSPYENFLNKKVLKKILKIQLEADGNIQNNNIRAALSVYGGQSVGQFNTGYAKYFCSQYNSGENILDPCAGFGSRLVGCSAMEFNYFGIEPSNKTYEGLCSLQEWLKGKSNSIITLIHGCVEDQDLPENFFDMAFTSPPYFNKEEYDYDSTQSFIRYPDFNVWCEKFLKVLIFKVYQSLKHNCYFILNIDDVDGRFLTETAIRYAKNVGFSHNLTLFSSNVVRPGTSKFSAEPFLILKKE